MISELQWVGFPPHGLIAESSWSPLNGENDRTSSEVGCATSNLRIFNRLPI